MKLIIDTEVLILKQCSINDLPNFVVLTGENGSGKTQLLKLISIWRGQGARLLNEQGEEFRTIVFADAGLATPSDDIHPSAYFEDLRLQWKKIEILARFSTFFRDLDMGNDETVAKANQDFSDLATSVMSGNSNKSPSQQDRQFTKQEFLTIIELCNKTGKTGEQLNFIDYFAFHQLPSSLFSSTLSLIFHQFAIKKKYYPESVADKQAPWDLFNALLLEAGFGYSVSTSIDQYNQGLNEIVLKPDDIGQLIHVSALSVGEQTLMSLTVLLYNSREGNNFPDVLVLDEPDAFLHPKFANIFLKVIQRVLVDEKGIRLIITTHSPSTVALSPPDSIYLMKRTLGYPVKADLNEAVRYLTNGLSTLNISIDNRKQIYTEAKNDQLFYQQLFERMQTKNMLSKDQFLTFIQVSRNKNTEGGGFEKVVDLTDSLYSNGNGNSSIYGLIDWDCEDRQLSDRISIFAEKTRYNIENFIYDPLFIACLCLQKELPNKKLFGLDDTDHRMDYLEFNSQKLQGIIDKISSQVQRNVDWDKAKTTSTAPIKVQLLNNMTIKVPEWYLKVNGHIIEKACRDTFETLKSHETPKMISEILLSYFMWLPVEVKTTFETLQARRIRED
ncbi:ATP-binding protein [Dyadobacter diqingensis]|uniref:ATP-binding protein n=1 Tax=Dyadobacter diqingensis TaxID=2938121 RepID=UPI0020C1E269|nr:ATP-binding protein [Dyadobacter diqingensis]